MNRDPKSRPEAYDWTDFFPLWSTKKRPKLLHEMTEDERAQHHRKMRAHWEGVIMPHFNKAAAEQAARGM